MRQQHRRNRRFLIVECIISKYCVEQLKLLVDVLLQNEVYLKQLVEWGAWRTPGCSISWTRGETEFAVMFFVPSVLSRCTSIGPVIDFVVERCALSRKPPQGGYGWENVGFTSIVLIYTWFNAPWYLVTGVGHQYINHKHAAALLVLSQHAHDKPSTYCFFNRGVRGPVPEEYSDSSTHHALRARHFEAYNPYDVAVRPRFFVSRRHRFLFRYRIETISAPCCCCLST